MSKLKRPSLPSRYLGKVKHSLKKTSISQPKCARSFTIVWVNKNGKNFNTTGFSATLRTIEDQEIDTERFNGLGQVCFYAPKFPTVQPFFIYFFKSSSGEIYRKKLIPQGTGTFAVIG